jgi:hypothetical protein
MEKEQKRGRKEKQGGEKVEAGGERRPGPPFHPLNYRQSLARSIGLSFILHSSDSYYSSVYSHIHIYAFFNLFF